MTANLHSHSFHEDIPVSWHVADSDYTIDDKRAYRLDLGLNSAVYVDEAGLVDLLRKTMKFGIAQRLLCPVHAGECEPRISTDCCGLEQWQCEVKTVVDRTTGDEYYECADPASCGLAIHPSSLADHANGDAR